MASIVPVKKMSLPEKLKLLDKTCVDLNTAAKKTVIGRIGANPEIEEKLTLKFIPFPLDKFNQMTGGGIPKGKTTIFVGEPDSGKTGTALETISYNQKIDPSFIALWLESEESLNKDDLCKTYNIDPDRFYYLQHEREGAGEKALDAAETVLATGAIDMFVINSLKCIVPSEELKKQFDESSMAVQARMNSRMTKKFTPLAAEHDTAIVIITHLSIDIGKRMGDNTIISGGRAILHASMLTLDYRRHSIGDKDPITRDQGIKIGVSTRKNHCMQGSNPYKKIEFFVIFGEGMEQYLEIMQIAVDKGILSKAGAYIKELDEKGEIKEINGEKLNWQGKAAFREYCKTHPEYFQYLKDRVGNNLVQNMTAEEIAEAQRKESSISNIKSNEIEDVIDIGRSRKRSTKK